MHLKYTYIALNKIVKEECTNTKCDMCFEKLSFLGILLARMVAERIHDKGGARHKLSLLWLGSLVSLSRNDHNQKTRGLNIARQQFRKGILSDLRTMGWVVVGLCQDLGIVYKSILFY